ncbi:hypothetical protein DSO57_1023702 [Entomophthora muscae]|uniref:Uncharacterized protein n=1 Tax=Entomophthora muscae TaxID=34485 RepID=A0ACC2SS27_9FUNG|nr:hypothetical protein DSO57_1023702 [Entomophthora muscae]
MNHLIFTAVLTACLGIRGYQQGPEFFGPSSEGLGHDSHYDPGQLNSSYSGSWPPLVSLHSTLSVAVYTSMYYVLMYFAGSFGRYYLHAKVFCWLMTIYPIITALNSFQFANLLPYLLQVVPTVTGESSSVNFMNLKSSWITNQIQIPKENTGFRPNPVTTAQNQEKQVINLGISINERTPSQDAILPLLHSGLLATRPHVF